MFPCLPRDRRDQHCVASHPVPRSELVYNLRLTGPEIRTFRAFDLVSSFPIPNLRSGVAESLRLIPEKFPFYRDYRRRLVRSRLPPRPYPPHLQRTRGALPLPLLLPSAFIFWVVRVMLVPLTPAARNLGFPSASRLARMRSLALMELLGMIAILF
jgi:hypothetical protein